MRMECMILAETPSRRQEMAWQLENLGAEWHCTGAANAAQAYQQLAERPVQLAVLCACNQAPARDTAPSVPETTVPTTQAPTVTSVVQEMIRLPPKRS